MKAPARLIVALMVGAVPVAVPVGASAVEAVAVKVTEEAAGAWAQLQAADLKIGVALAAGNLAEVGVQAERVRTATLAIVRGVRPTDEAAIRRLNSAGREVLSLAERLAAVAGAGNRGRAEAVFANLHRYVEFIQSKLPPGGAGAAGRSKP